jgi:hypothetical protein
VEWRTIVEDLAVTLSELDLWVSEVRGQALWLVLVEQALALPGLVAAHGPPSADELVSLSEVVAERGQFLVDEMAQPLEDIGHTQGYLYNTPAWIDVCRERSALEALRELGLTIDVENLDRLITRYSLELFDQPSVPDGIPRSHWWWFEWRSGSDW